MGELVEYNEKEYTNNSNLGHPSSRENLHNVFPGPKSVWVTPEVVEYKENEYQNHGNLGHAATGGKCAQCLLRDP
jgi:hypothetical protein